MSYPIRAEVDALQGFSSRHGIDGRPTRSLVRQSERAAEQGIVAGTRIQAAGYAAHYGMVSLAMISAEANHLAEAAPGIDPVEKTRTAERLNNLADTYARVVAAEIAGLGW